MEDPNTLKWTIITAVVAFNIIVWIAVAAILRRARVRPARQTAQNSKQQGCSTESDKARLIQILQEIAEKQIDTQERVVPEHSARELLAEATSAMQSQPIDTAHRRKQPRNPYADQPTNAAKQPENPENYAESPDSEPFDLRQAVIISEILKSKFDE